MTREQAEDMVCDLVRAFGVYDVAVANFESHRERYLEMRERVVVALMTVTPAESKP